MKQNNIAPSNRHKTKEELAGRISQLSCILAEKELIDKYELLPEDLADSEGGYLPEYQDYFNNYYDCYYNELLSYIKF